MDTIFALASARGKAGVAVVRISGPAASDVFSAFQIPAPHPRVSSIRKLFGSHGLIDEALVLRFEAPHSFTGEDTVELQCHGSLAIVDAVLSELSQIVGFRPADPGEFTRRALENERLDLAQVEGLSDLIEAETEAQRRLAVNVFSGSLGALAESWRVRLVRAAALLEATIDFVDEDVPVDVVPEVSELLESVARELRKEVNGVGIAERIRDGFEVAIIGPPNAGKSTLLNALAGRDAAITSEVAGTTRDVIEVRMDLGGLPVTVLDTAGMRETDDQVEAIGVDRARNRASAADIRVILLDAQDALPVIDPGPDDLVLRARSDVDPTADFSGKTGAGIDAIVSRLTAVLEGRVASVGVAMRERHRQAMVSALGSLGIATDRLNDTAGLSELIAEDLRSAVRALDSLVGRVDVEHVLDDIFSSFCIGK